MKKINPDVQEWVIRQQRNEQKRSKKAKHKKNIIRSHSFLAPVDFSLYNRKSADKTLRFINKIKSFNSHDVDLIILNFVNTTSITAAATLCLHSTVSVIKQFNKGVRFRYINVKDPLHNELLSSLGFLREDVDISDEAITIPNLLPIRTGVAHDAGHSVNKVVTDMDKTFYSGELEADLEKRNVVYQAIHEALLNITNHAYEDFEDKFLRLFGERWWVLGHQINDQIHIALYDLGHGIPVTLPKQSGYEKVRGIVSEFLPLGNDCAMIKAATEFRRSRYEQEGSGRGTGLDRIMRFAKNNPQGLLWIFSNKGTYLYDNVSVNKKSETMYDSKHSINGTLIQWNISLPSSTERK